MMLQLSSCLRSKFLANFVLALASGVVAAACGEDSSEPADTSETDTSGEVSDDTSDAEGSGDVTDDADSGEIACSESGSINYNVVYRLKFTRVVDGVVPGLNLDDRVSDSRDREGCSKPDFLGPNGETGIDNQFATLMPAIDATEISAVEGLVQTAIDEGELLLIAELSGVDDLMNDDCVDFRLMQGIGVPVIGTNGFIEAGQTFDPDREVPVSEVKGARIVDGKILAGPVNLVLQLTVFGNFINLNVSSAFFDFTIDERGEYNGVVAGSLVAADLNALVDGLVNVDSGVGPLIATLLDTSADLAPDENGKCQEISVALEFQSNRAFLFEEF